MAYNLTDADKILEINSLLLSGISKIGTNHGFSLDWKRFTYKNDNTVEISISAKIQNTPSPEPFKEFNKNNISVVRNALQWRLKKLSSEEITFNVGNINFDQNSFRAKVIITVA